MYRLVHFKSSIVWRLSRLNEIERERREKEREDDSKRC